MNNNRNRKIRITIFFASILTIITTLVLVTVIGKGLIDNFKAQNQNGKISISNVDPKYTEDLTSQLVYSGQANGSEQYYSASIDAVFTLNRSLFNVIESTTQISIYPKDYFSTDFYNNITVSNYDPDYIMKYKDSLKKLYPDIKVEEEGTVETLNYFKVSYSKKDYFNSTNKTLMSEMIIYRIIDKKIVLSKTSYTKDFDLNKYSSNLSKLINTIELNPKNINSTAKLQIKKGSLELKYDRKKFDISYNSDDGAFLSYRPLDNETNSKYKYLTHTFSINTSSISEPSTVLQMLKEYRDFDFKLFKDKKFSVVKDNYKIIIDNREFIATDYKYDFIGKTQLITLIVGKAPFATNYVILKLSTVEPESNGYKDTMALVKSITFKDIQPLQSNSVTDSNKSNPNPSAKILGTSSVDIDKSAIIGKMAVVHVYTKACVDVKVKDVQDLVNSGGKKYTYCYGLFGSGFFVSSDGYLITNGHVAIPNALDLLTNDLTQTSQISLFWHDIVSDGLTLLKAQGYDVTTLSNNEIIGVGLKFTKYLIDNNYLTLTPTYQNYIEGDTPFNIDPKTYNVSNGKLIKFVDGQVDSSTLISIAAAANKPTGITHPDVAILKAEGNNYPALSLSDSKFITSGQKIQVIGFPGSANNSSLFGAETSRIATITNGSISAIKSNTNGTFKLLQIDASISHGNSGGPILNSEGEVVGIATYKVNGEESADFNAGVSVEEISNLLKKNNISIMLGSTSGKISQGVDNFSKSYYKLAITDFKEAINLYSPTSEVLTPMINIAQEKVNQGKDETPVVNTLNIESVLNKYGLHLSGISTLILLISIVSFMIFGTVTVVAIFINRRRLLNEKRPIIGNAEIPTITNEVSQPTNAPNTITNASNQLQIASEVMPAKVEMPLPVIENQTEYNSVTQNQVSQPYPTIPAQPTEFVSNSNIVNKSSEQVSLIASVNQPENIPTVTPNTVPVQPENPLKSPEVRTQQIPITRNINGVKTEIPVSLTSSYNPLPTPTQPQENSVTSTQTQNQTPPTTTPPYLPE